MQILDVSRIGQAATASACTRTVDEPRCPRILLHDDSRSRIVPVPSQSSGDSIGYSVLALKVLSLDYGVNAVGDGVARRAGAILLCVSGTDEGKRQAINQETEEPEDGPGARVAQEREWPRSASGPGARVAQEREWPRSASGPGARVAQEREWPRSASGPGARVAQEREWPRSASGPGARVAQEREWPRSASGPGARVAQEREWPRSASGPGARVAQEREWPRSASERMTILQSRTATAEQRSDEV